MTADRVAPGPTGRQDAVPARLRGHLGRRIEATAYRNLLQLDWDTDFLGPFQAQSSAPEFYVGLGKTLEALVRLADYTGSEELLALKRQVVAALVATQDASGYLGTYPPEQRFDHLWDVHELSYVILALLADAQISGNAAAREAAVRAGDCLVGELTRDRIEGISGRLLHPALSVIGLDRAMLALARETGDGRYTDFCRDALGLESWDLPVVEGRGDHVEGHIYAYLSRCVAQLELYEQEPAAGLLERTRAALGFLVDEQNLYATGVNGVGECWDRGHDGLGQVAETCSTAYLVRLCDHLVRLTGEASFADLAERAVYNALLAAQSPDGRLLRYWTPFESSRVYWDRDTYCCPGNFRRIMSELPDMVYQRSTSGVSVTHFVDSEARVPLPSGGVVHLRQQTDYPSVGAVRLQVGLDEAEEFDLRVRVPAWSTLPRVRVNGDEVDLPPSGGYGVLRRLWRDGDVVELDLAMPLRLIPGRRAQEGRFAVARGPLVYAVNPARNADGSPDGSSGPVLATSLRLVPDETVRPGGTAVVGRTTGGATVTLSEFIDPGADRTYLLVEADEALPTAEELWALPVALPVRDLSAAGSS